MYTGKTSRRSPLKARNLLLAATLLLVIVGAGAGLYFWKSNPATPVAQYPKYLAFAGSYVFSVPKSYVLDDQSLPGIQLLYTGQISVNTLGDAYKANAIALQPVTDLSDKKGDAFKKRVNDTFVKELKKLSPNTKVTFGSEDGLDVVRIVVTKDGKPLRFVYIKNSKHPVEIVAKEETLAVKEIEQSVVDVEYSELKKEIGPIKLAVGAAAALVKDQKGTELYERSAPVFRTKSTEADLANSLQKAAPYLQGTLAINGAAYKINPSEFTAVFTAPAATKDAKPTSGVIYLTKVDGEWKMRGLSLPSPATAASASSASTKNQ